MNGLLEFIQRRPLSRRIIYALGRHRALVVERWLSGLLRENDRILDIGSGTCNVCEVLRRKNEVVPIDIQDLSFTPGISPLIYDGERLPFENDAFSVALLCTVLHHTPDPIAILKEAKRVARRILIIEDIYSNPIQKHLTFFTDSLVNLEFKGYPHTNKTDGQWKKVFQDLGLHLVEARYFRVFLFYRQVVYCVERRDQ